MSSEKATAIVLRTVEFSETSLVVTLYSREFGKIGALAKGARRHKGPFESALDLLALCRIVFLRKSSESLDLVTEAKLLRRFRVARDNLQGLWGGYYVAELLDGLTHEGSASPELFDLAEATLAALAAGGDVGRAVARFELGLLRLLGLLPSLDCCAECGEQVPADKQVMFGHLDGGVLCRRCREGKTHVATLSASVLRTMVQLAAPDERPWRQMEIDPRTAGQLRGVMNQYMAHLLGRKPRMQAYLKWTTSTTASP
ncbi:MAG TPA: DNA repair protein RecO [Thermoguttaceae bacterium]|nr:DNA repair protein RecO [Thermoguttaceae bacterium]